MPFKTHIDDSRQLVSIALASSHARKYEESTLLIKLALHLLLEDLMDQDLEAQYNDLCVWKEFTPKPKSLHNWSGQFIDAIKELDKNEKSVAFMETIPMMFDYGLVPVTQVEKCRNEVLEFLTMFKKSLNAATREDLFKEILSTSDVAKMFGVTSQTVLMWCKAGRMPGAYQTPGGTWKIPRQALRKIEGLLEASTELDAFIPDQETVNDAVSERRKAWRK